MKSLIDAGLARHPRFLVRCRQWINGTSRKRRYRKEAIAQLIAGRFGYQTQYTCGILGVRPQRLHEHLERKLGGANRDSGNRTGQWEITLAQGL